MQGSYLGPEFSSEQIREFLAKVIAKPGRRPGSRRS